MLDPRGRKEVMSVVDKLNKEKMTVVVITHYMEEVIHADAVFVMDGGKLKMSGTPRGVFSRVEELKEMRLAVPQATELAWELKQAGLDLPDGILDRRELTDALVKIGKADGRI